MRLIALADTHGYHDELVVPDGDVLVHAGDMTTRGTLDELSAGSATVNVTVQRPDDTLVQLLMALDSVESVARPTPNRFVITAELDAREHIAAAAIPYGLIELSSARRLEDVYLQLTGNT